MTSEANKVFVAMEQLDFAPSWSFLVPIDNAEGDDNVAADIIGIGAFLYDMAHAKNPSEDAAIRRLRLSPAFIRSIGR